MSLHFYTLGLRYISDLENRYTDDVDDEYTAELWGSKSSNINERTILLLYEIAVW